MASLRLLLVMALLVVPAFSVSSDAKVSPVQKVLQMMDEMKAKGIEEKEAETATFTTMMQFCKDTSAAKSKAISDGEDEMGQLKADIEKYASDVKVLGNEIQKLDRLADEAKGDKSSSTQQFRVEEADYQKLHSQYEENVVDMEVGISNLKSMMSSTQAASASFIQKMVSKPKFPEHAKRALLAFLSTSTSASEKLEAPDGAVFESQSGGIESILQDLKGKLLDEKSTLEREYLKTTGSYQMLQQTFANQIDQHTDMRNHKAATKKDKESALATAQGDLEQTAGIKAQDEAYLTDVQSECAQESSDYETRQKLRAGEITALNKAIEIISGGAVSGAATKHLPNLVQYPSLAQLRSSLTRPSQSVAASFLQAQGQRISSKVLEALSSHVAGDPFAKVKKMIQDMVFKLMEEANEEAEQKGFCDAELGTNKMTRDHKTSSIDELTASIDEMGAKMAQLGGDISNLSARIAELDSAIQTATMIRQEEKTKNTQTIAEASAASDAVERALAVLNDYYQSAAAATSLVQRRSETSQKAPFQGQQSGSTGVLGMLEVILSDFARLESDTKSNEVMSQQSFTKFMSDSNLDKSVGEQQLKDKSESRTETDVDLAAANKDLESTQAELTAANAYFEKLKPTCASEVVTYEERVARRKEEIESLKEALKLLDEQPIA